MWGLKMGNNKGYYGDNLFLQQFYLSLIVVYLYVDLYVLSGIKV
jgi:hypothetical protein